MSVFVAALLLAGAACAVLALRLFAGYPPRPAGLRALSAREAALVAAAADATFPPGGALEPSGTEAGVVEHLDRFLAALPARPRRLVRALLFLIEHATLAFPAPGPRGWRRFSSLSPEQRVAVLDGWRRSRLFARRLAFTSLRALLTMGYLSSPEVMRRLNLAPRRIEPRVLDADLLYPPVGRPRSAIRWRPEDRTGLVDRPPLGPETPLHPAFEAERPGAPGEEAR